MGKPNANCGRATKESKITWLRKQDADAQCRRYLDHLRTINYGAEPRTQLGLLADFPVWLQKIRL